MASSQAERPRQALRKSLKRRTAGLKIARRFSDVVALDETVKIGDGLSLSLDSGARTAIWSGFSVYDKL